MEIRVLGPLAAYVDGTDVTPTSPSQRSVLAVLAAHPDHHVRADTLIDALWGSDPPPSAERFRDEIVPTARPLVMRGLLAHWPAVRAGREGAVALADFLRRHDRGIGVKVKIAPPEARGRFFYNDDLTGFNFRKEIMSVSAALDILLASAAETAPAALAIQSIQARHALPGGRAARGGAGVGRPVSRLLARIN